jgi:tetratricopeptide (TPR) repeat protein
VAEQLPADKRAQLDALPADLRQRAEQLDVPAMRPMAPFLAELHAAGLITKEVLHASVDTNGAAYSLHELVRERMLAWMDAHPDARAGRTTEDVWVAYGQRYAAVFENLYSAGREGSREAAAEAGRRGLVYLVRARAFEALSSFAGMLITGTRDPALLHGVISELRAVANQIPAGEARWRVRAWLGDALTHAGHPEQSLALYEQAEAEAEAAGHWSDVAWIRGNRASALFSIGRLNAARAARLASSAAHEKAGRPSVDVMGNELEVLRIDVMQGNARQALPEIEARLHEVRAWWHRHSSGEVVPQAPNRIILGNVLIGGLDIARYAYQTLGQAQAWQACLTLLDEIETIQLALGESAHQRARVCANRYGPLLCLGRINEAQGVLEHCLDVFGDVGNLEDQKKVLGALAILWHEHHDQAQAIALARQALALSNRFPAPDTRANSHDNLATLLDNNGHPGEAAPHRLAAILYFMVTGHHAPLPGSLYHLSVAMRRADTAYDLPRLADLVARPDFDALARFLDERRVDLADLQAAIDQLVTQVREAITAEPEDVS